MNRVERLSLADRFTLLTLKAVGRDAQLDAATESSLRALGLLTSDQPAVISEAGRALVEYLEAKEAAYFTEIAAAEYASSVDEKISVMEDKAEILQRLSHIPLDPYFSERISQYRERPAQLSQPSAQAPE